MAVWKPGKVKPVPLGKAPKPRKKGAPGVQTLKVTPPGGALGSSAGAHVGKGAGRGSAKGAAPTTRAPAGSSAWYDASQTGARDASIASMLANPLKPVTGTDAVSFARALAQSGIAPALQDYDRQAGLAQSRADTQTARTAAGTEQLRQVLAAQRATAQAGQDAARARITDAGNALQGSIDQNTAAASQAAQADMATRGAGLDGGAAAQRAQEAANAKARGLAGTSVALDQQAASAASGDQLLNQISAATAQQGGERQGAITNAFNSQLRDINEGRAKAYQGGEQTFLKAIMDLQNQNIQTNLATETLGLNKAKADADSAIEAAKLDQQAKIASLNAKIKVTEGAEQRKLRKELQAATDKQRALDRASRTDTADKNRDAANTRQDKALNAKAANDRKTGAKLTPVDKKRRAFITDVKTAQASGDLSNLKKQAKNASDFRRLLAEKLGVNDRFARQLLADLAYRGLEPKTVQAYKARYGRNPPAEWPRYKAPKASGLVADATGAVADALRGVTG